VLVLLLVGFINQELEHCTSNHIKIRGNSRKNDRWQIEEWDIHVNSRQIFDGQEQPT
jgi:hypothetical protein